MLSQKIVLTVPSTNCNQEPDLETHTRMVDHAENRFGEWFGGWTTTGGRGGWIGSQGKVVEDVALVTAFCDGGKLQVHEVNVKNLAAEIAYLMEQECVALEINGTLLFIEAKNPAKVAKGKKAA